MTQTPEPILPERPPRRSWARLALHVIGLFLLGLALASMTIWATLVVYYADLSGASPRLIRAILVPIAMLLVLLQIRPRRYALAAFTVLFLAILGWYFSLAPSNDRDWAADVARTPWVELQGNRIIVHDIRNFDYRSIDDFTPAWRDQTFDLDAVRSVDFALSYWGSKAIAHGIVSFGFADGQHLAVSIETRKEKTEAFSAVQGFFRQYELIYVVADERDVLGRRVKYSHEDVYLYRTRLKPAEARLILMSYVQSINSLHQTPQWYNALTENCIVSVIPHVQAARSSSRVTWRALLSGYVARQAYENGLLNDGIPFEELEARSHVNAAILAAPMTTDFSTRIRADLPDPGLARDK